MYILQYFNTLMVSLCLCVYSAIYTPFVVRRPQQKCRFLWRHEIIRYQDDGGMKSLNNPALVLHAALNLCYTSFIAQHARLKHLTEVIIYVTSMNQMNQ
jgi:hypothetical protein